MSSFRAFVISLIMAFAFLAAHASDPIRFAPPLRYAAGSGPTTVAVGDFNGDGKLDIVAGSRPDQKLYVLLGKGDGDFQTAVGYATANADPIGIVVADFTGDSVLDIVVATSMSGGSYPAYMVFAGHGDGAFAAPIITTESLISPMQISAADLNKDGKLDLLVGGNGSSGIAYGHGDGTFQSPSLILPAPVDNDYGWAIGSTDADKDGFLDVFLGTRNGYVALYRGKSGGGFEQPVATSVLDFSYGGITNIIALDVNKDGFPDLALSSFSSYAAALLVNDGHGVFGTPSLSAGGSQPTGMTAADFNGDGELDLAFSDYNSDPDMNQDFGVSIIRGALSPLANSSKGIYQFDGYTHNSGIAVGDFNGDTRPDIVTASPSLNAVSVLLNGGAINVTLDTSKNPALPDESITFTVHVAPLTPGGPVPTGSITFMNNAATLATVALDNNGAATLTTSFPKLPLTAIYPYYIGALYSGDANYIGSSSDYFAQQVGYATATAIAVSPSGVLPAGATTTLTATVSSIYGSPSGSVQFYDGSTRLTKVALNAGSASLTTAALSTGSHSFRGVYIRDTAAGSFGYLSSSASATVLVGVPQEQWSLSAVDFHTVLVGAPSISLPVTLTNSGTADLPLAGFATAGDYSQQNDCPAALPAASSCTITLCFRPRALGVRTGTLTNLSTNQAVVQLSGLGADLLLDLARVARRKRDSIQQTAAAAFQTPANAPAPAATAPIPIPRLAPFAWMWIGPTVIPPALGVGAVKEDIKADERKKERERKKSVVKTAE